MKSPFVVMAKPVGARCNLNCGYCYYLNTANHVDRDVDANHVEHDDRKRHRMSDILLERYIRQYVEASPGPVVHFTWHGGEPTLAGLDFYRHAVELQKRFLPEGWTCWNNFQTNGVLLDDEWCKFLADEHFDVGLSLDGTQWLHDRNRKDRGGHGSYERARSAVQRLQLHGLQPDLLCTVTSYAVDDAVSIYSALKELNTGWVQFIPIVRRDSNGQVSDDSVSGEGYGRFMKAVLNEWLLNDIGRIGVQLFAEITLVWSGGQSGLCWMSPTCGRALVLEQDGSVYSCDHFVRPDHRIGSIVDSSLGELVDSDEQLSFGNAKRDKLTAQCRACRWLDVCNGGCPKDRFALSLDGESGHYYLCDGLREFFAFAEPPLRRLMQLRQQNIAPKDMMSVFRAEAASLWSGIGRNDPCPCGSGRKAKQCCWALRP